MGKEDYFAIALIIIALVSIWYGFIRQGDNQATRTMNIIINPVIPNEIIPPDVSSLPSPILNETIQIGAYNFTFIDSTSDTSDFVFLGNTPADERTGWTDQKYNIYIVNRNQTLGKTRIVCQHEVCHNLIKDIPLDIEEEICLTIEQLLIVEPCNRLEAVLRAKIGK